MTRVTELGCEVIIGRYALYGEIASGGMATVHLGRLLGAVGFARTVAIKRLHPGYARDPEFVAMFLDEARLAVRVQHPNVVPVFDVVAMKKELFLVMEYVHGEALSRLLRLSTEAGRPVPPRVAAAIVVGALHGLHAAHNATDEQGNPLGIVHRDISPHNIIVGIDGIARVLDFGIAKASRRLQTTREGQFKGKLTYMAPEQVQGKEVDRRTDVYATSVVLWEALTSQRLFEAEDEVALVYQIVEHNIATPSSREPKLPLQLDPVVMKGLSPSPDERYPTALAMAMALEDTIGVASQREVGEWVRGICGAQLQARADHVLSIERMSASEPTLADVASPPSSRSPAGLSGAPAEFSAAPASVAVATTLPAGAAPAAPWPASPDSPPTTARAAGVEPRAQPRSPLAGWPSGVWILGGLGVVLVLGVGLMVVGGVVGAVVVAPALRGSSGLPASQVASATSVTSAPPVASAGEPPPPSPPLAAAASSPPPAAQGAPAGAPVSPHQAAASLPGKPVGAVVPRPGPAARPAAANCNPPFYYENGMKLPKPGCFGAP